MSNNNSKLQLISFSTNVPYNNIPLNHECHFVFVNVTSIFILVTVGLWQLNWIWKVSSIMAQEFNISSNIKHYNRALSGNPSSPDKIMGIDIYLWTKHTHSESMIKKVAEQRCLNIKNFWLPSASEIGGLGHRTFRLLKWSSLVLWDHKITLFFPRFSDQNSQTNSQLRKKCSSQSSWTQIVFQSTKKSVTHIRGYINRWMLYTCELTLEVSTKPSRRKTAPNNRCEPTVEQIQLWQ